jgi:hypothetical protein
MLIVSIIGLVSFFSDSRESAETQNAESANAQIAIITDTVTQYTTYLSDAADLPFIRGAADEDPAARSESNNFLARYIENVAGAHDIIITNVNGRIFSSYTGEYVPTNMFFDPDLPAIAASPTGVSGFYDGGRFYCARPIRDEDNTIVGYIILEAEQDLIADLLIIEDSEVIITVSDDLNAGYELEIAGTSWYWNYTYPHSFFLIFGVWFTAFAIAAAVCIVNIIIMFMITKRMNYKAGDE